MDTEDLAQKGTSICLTGANVEETASALCSRLIEMGRAVELIDSTAVNRLTRRSAAVICGALSRNGVIVIVTAEDVRPEGDSIDIEVDAHDTAEFAAEKIIDALADAEVIRLDTTGYTPEEEEQIRKRLADLGYIE